MQWAISLKFRIFVQSAHVINSAKSNENFLKSCLQGSYYFESVSFYYVQYFYL